MILKIEGETFVIDQKIFKKIMSIIRSQETGDIRVAIHGDNPNIVNTHVTQATVDRLIEIVKPKPKVKGGNNESR